MRICSIDGCGLKHKAYGRCSKHHDRWTKHGDPSIGAAKTPRGEPKRWILAHVGYEQDQCLPWPFSSMTNGYPWVWWNGRGTGAHRVMCELAHGPAPDAEHEAAHSCGNGNQGCVNQKHLRWATKAANEADKEAHGTRLHGSKIKWAKLSEADLSRIKSMLGSHTDIQIAKEFGVSDSAIYLIRIGKNWKRAA